MPNPDLSQAVFDRIGERTFYLLAKYMSVREKRYQFEGSSCRIYEENDTASSTSDWSLSGVELGTNTDSNGVLFVRISDETPGSGQATVDLYKATGGSSGNKVATGSGADGSTITLSEENSSGITGSVKLGTITASETNDAHRLRCWVDYPVRDVQVFDGTEMQDYALRARTLASNAQAVDLFKQIEALMVADFVALLQEYVAARINAGSSQALVKGFVRDQGAVSLRVTGILEELRDAMQDNTTVQYVLQTVVNAGAASFDAGNSGKGSVSSPTFYEKILPGTITFRCADETIGREEFDVVLTRSDTGEKVAAQSRLRVKREFKDANIGIQSLTLQRVFSKTGDGSHTNLSSVTDGNWSTVGESSSNTNAGTLYWKIVSNGSNWDVEFYKASTLQSGDLVAKATNYATNAIFQAVQQNGSGLTVNGKVGSGPTNGTTGSFLLQPFKSGPPADVFTIVISHTSSGEIQKLLSEMVDVGLDWFLNSAASGSVTLPDALLLRGGAVLKGRN